MKIAQEIRAGNVIMQDNNPWVVLKTATLATGMTISVPLFVQTGDKVEIDTRTHEYRKRV